MNSERSSSKLLVLLVGGLLRSSGRSRTSWPDRAEAMISTSVSAWRSRASRIMRPTRGSSGSFASSRPMGVSSLASSTAPSSPSSA
jgi:hypothetical protein